MIAADWIALLPLMVLSGAVAIQLLVVSFWRRHGLVAWLTVIAFGATLASIPFALPVLPREVTPLFWFDRYGAFFYALFAAAGIVTTLLSYRYLQRRRGDLEEYYILLATATIGAMAMASAAHFASFLLGLELLSISLYVLVGYPEEHHAPLEAALKYLLLSGVASTTMLFGMALIYLDTGTLEFAKLATVLRGGDVASLYLVVGNTFCLPVSHSNCRWCLPHVDARCVRGCTGARVRYLATVSKARCSLHCATWSILAHSKCVAVLRGIRVCGTVDGCR
jgi:NADH-quinone oxidoreductase subunit N